MIVNNGLMCQGFLREMFTLLGIENAMMHTRQLLVVPASPDGHHVDGVEGVHPPDEAVKAGA